MPDFNRCFLLLMRIHQINCSVVSITINNCRIGFWIMYYILYHSKKQIEVQRNSGARHYFLYMFFIFVFIFSFCFVRFFSHYNLCLCKVRSMSFKPIHSLFLRRFIQNDRFARMVHQSQQFSMFPRKQKKLYPFLYIFVSFHLSIVSVKQIGRESVHSLKLVVKQHGISNKLFGFIFFFLVVHLIYRCYLSIIVAFTLHTIHNTFRSIC